MHKFLLLGIVFLVGCSGETREPVYSVHGQVLWEGQPLAGALVVLHRLDKQGRNLTARTDPFRKLVVSDIRRGLLCHGSHIYCLGGPFRRACRRNVKGQTSLSPLQLRNGAVDAPGITNSFNGHWQRR